MVIFVGIDLHNLVIVIATIIMVVLEDHVEGHLEEHLVEHLEDHDNHLDLVIANRLNDLGIEVVALAVIHQDFALAAIRVVQDMLGSADITSSAIVSILEGVIDLDFAVAVIDLDFEVAVIGLDFEVAVIGLEDHINSVALQEHFD